MGATFSTVFESEAPPYGTIGGDHCSLCRQQDLLDRWANENGLTPLGAFESYSPEDAENFFEEISAEFPPVRWFAPADGLAAVNALWELLDARPGVFARQAELMEDLSEIGVELEAAQKAGVRFRFAVLP